MSDLLVAMALLVQIEPVGLLELGIITRVCAFVPLAITLLILLAIDRAFPLLVLSTGLVLLWIGVVVVAHGAVSFIRSLDRASNQPCPRRTVPIVPPGDLETIGTTRLRLVVKVA
jgi:hypothetical protein